MPINLNDPRYVAEKSPQSLINLGGRLKRAYGVGADNFGVKGNEYHSSGFHRSRNWIFFSPDSRYGTSDYSVQGTRNHGGDPDNDCAFDFTPATWGTADNRAKMITITKRLRAAARANDPRLQNWFEFAGTEDGVNVVTFYAQGGGSKTPFDSSHLDHVHGSGYRDSIESDHTGLCDIMLGVNIAEEEDMGSFGPVQLNLTNTSLVVPPVGAGFADPEDTWLNVGHDGFGVDAAVRVWASDGAGNFAPLPGYAGGLIRLKSGFVVSAQLVKGTRLVSISRKALNAGGTVVEPGAADALPVFDGSISVCFERKPV